MNFIKNKKLFPVYSLLTVIPVLLFIFIRVIGFDGLYGQDSYEYSRYASELFNFLNTGKDPGDYFWPLFYPLIGALVNLVFQDIVLTLSIISLSTYTISAIYIYKIIVLLNTNNSHALYFVVVFFIFSPAIFTLGLVVMSDMLSVSFIILSVYHFLKFNKHNSLKSLYYIIIFATCAIMTRYASFLILFPFGILVLLKLLKRKRLFLHFIPLLIIVGILCIPHFYIRSDNISEFLGHSWLQKWSFLNFFKSQFLTLEDSIYYRFPNIIYGFFNVFHPRFLFIGIVLLFASSLKGIKFKPNKILLVTYILYSLFLAGIPFQNPRFLALNFGLVLILLFPVFQGILKKFSSQKKIINGTLLFVLLIQLFFCYKVFNHFYIRNQLEKNMVDLMKPYQNKTLYSFDIDIALKGRGLDFNYKRLWVSQYDKFASQDLVLFNPEKFELQWKGKNPMLNWKNIVTNYSLKVLEEGPEGWKLYEILNKKQQ